MKSMLFRKIAIAICLALLCIISIASFKPVKSAFAYSVRPCDGLSCDGQLPQMHEDCLRSSFVVKWENVVGGQIDFKYSSTCHAFFGVVIASEYSNHLYTDIARANPDTGHYQNQSQGVTMFSQMIGWNGQTGQRVGLRGCVGGFSANCANLAYP
jgi:hypothetical protein